MTVRPNIKFTAELSLNEVEIEALEHITGYQYIDEFFAKCSRSVDAEDIKNHLRGLHAICERLLEAKKKAFDVMLGRD